MKHVCFIQPPIEDFYATPVRRQPLGILYLAAVAEKSGWTTSLINGHSPKKKVIPIPAEFNYLVKHFQDSNKSSPFPFKNYYHFGLSYDAIRKRIRETNADLFAVSALFTPYFQETDRVMELVRQEHPRKPIVVGGNHATMYPVYYLENSRADYVIAGEAEAGFASLLQAIDKTGTQADSINGVLTANYISPESKSPTPENLNLLPFPARHLLKKRSLKIYKQNGTSLLFSRGCPNRCRFCTSRFTFGLKYRTRAVENLLAEMGQCHKQFGITFFNFEDDNLFHDPVQSINLLEGLIRFKETTCSELDLAAMNGISLEHVEPDLLNIMKRAGFSEINLSLVTASQKQQAKLLRPFQSKKFESISKRATILGMNVRAYFILGLPSQTLDEITHTLGFIRGLGIKAFPSVYYNVINKEQKDWKIQRSSAFANETEHLSREDLLSLFHKSMLTNIEDKTSTIT